ncbi:MAG: cobalamin-dependent protein [Acidimicrobiia bacterium]|nr:cobalamin-dependent protein [Acidimicrobiia bacterium]
MAKLLLAHPLVLAMSPAEQEASSPYFPLGLLYVAGYVRAAGHDVAIFDGTFADDYDAFDAALVTERPDVVGISGVLPTREAALILAAKAKRNGRVVIAGGPDPTAHPAAYLTGGAFDVVVHHEGEQTIGALLDRHDSGELTVDGLADEPGVAYRRDADVVVTPPRPPIDDLDALPLPARDLIDVERYLDAWDDANGYRSITVSTSRGCPYGCSWCTDAVHGAGFRQRSPESVAAEVRSLADRYDITRLRLVDDVDGIERGWLERWAEAAEALGAAIPFEALNDLQRRDIPLLDVRDTL